jgi:hypothetical protein
LTSERGEHYVSARLNLNRAPLMKSIPELKAEEARIRAILDAGAEAELRAIPGVIHVSVGLKQVNGTATDEFCIRVYVAEKKEPSAIPPAERIPKSIQGIPTDVNQVKVVDAHVDSAKYRPITGGIEITNNVVDVNGQIGLGTLGCLATDNSDGKTVLVTNFHVIGGTAGVTVFQPGTGAAGDAIGTVKRGQITGTIDAAIADIDPAIATTTDEINGLFLNSSNHIAGVTDPVGGMRAFKVGRTTGLTDGKVVDPDSVVTINYDPPVGPKSLSKAILIQCTKVSGCCCCTCNVVDSSRKFSDHGDSGSAVLNDQRMAIGLIMAGDSGESYACRMSEVESGMNVTINRTVVVAPPALAVAPAGGAAPGGAVVPPLSATAAPVASADETVWSIMQRRMEETPFGRDVGAQVRIHLPEAIDLVNHHRAVMVAWQRVQGPAFLAQWMNGVRNPSVVVPKEINGVTMNSALLRLSSVLKEYGSPALSQSIDSYGLELMALLDRSETVDELIENAGNPVPA